MIREPSIALAFTAEPWVEALHRHFADHGGARVRQLVMDPALALDDEYEVLVASARWPALTPGLVRELHARGRAVLGVASRDDRGSVDVLTAAEVDRIVMADAAPREFLEALFEIAPTTPATTDPAEPDAPSSPTVVGSGAAGTGSTEVAIALAAIAARTRAVALIDADEVGPSVAQRLALPIEPNLRTAIDAVEYRTGSLDDAVQTGGSPSRRNGLRVIGGLPGPHAWSHVRPNEVARVARALGQVVELVVLDVAAPLDDVGPALRGRYALTRALVGDADQLVAVASGTPVGLTRLVNWLADAHQLNTVAPVHVVLNRAPRDAFRRRELVDELERCYRPASLTLLPDDPKVAKAAWSGTLVARGVFTRGIETLVGVVTHTPAPSRRRVAGRSAARIETAPT